MSCRPLTVHCKFSLSHLHLNSLPHDLHYLHGTLIYLKDHLFMVGHCFSWVERERHLHASTRGQHIRYEAHFQKRGVGE